VEKGNPPRTKPGELRKAAARLAAASLLARKWRKGRRNETALALAGMLLRAGWNEDEAAEFIESVAEAANDEEWEKRGAAVEATQKKLDSGKQVTGIPKLVELLGEKTVNSVCEWLSIGKKALKEQVATVDELLEDADSLPEIHPSQAFHDGVFWYGLPLGEEKIWVNSRGEFFTLEEMRIHFSLPVSPTISRWSLSSVKRFRAGKTNVDVGALFLELRYFISRRIHFVASWQPTVVTLWIMGTYVYRVFDWFGYLWLTSPGRRTGKTRLLEIISAFAYNATSVMTDPTEASLFRETAFNASTQILDEVESLRAGDQEKKAALMSMLNAGFKSRSKVPRFNLGMNRIEYHDAFCPRVLAGISRLAPTLVDRCLKVFLKRKLKEEKVARFSERKLSKYLQHQRNLLYKFGLRCAPSIAKQYEAADSFPIPKAVDDRARDILEPLYAIATVLDEQNQKLKITEQLIYAAERIAKDRAADEGEDEEVVAALQALAEKFPKSSDHWILTSVEAQSHFHRHDALEWVENRRQAARLLRQLGFKSAPHRQWTDVVRGYRIERHKLTDLCERYGVEPPKRKRG